MILPENVAVHGCISVCVALFNLKFLVLLLMQLIYSKGLNSHQTAFAVKKYKSHCHVGLPDDIITLMAAGQA
jgi:hypothetical protein